MDATLLSLLGSIPEVVVVTCVKIFIPNFYQRLLCRHKAPLQAVGAVMRKLLHAFFAMTRIDQPNDRSKLWPAEFPFDTIAACA
jgi:hypothetical protein